MRLGLDFKFSESFFGAARPDDLARRRLTPRVIF